MSSQFDIKALLAKFKEAPTSSKFKYLLLVFFAYQFLKSVAKANGKWFKKDISGQHVFITGGAMGLGKNLAKRMLALNCKVSICDVNEAQLKIAEQEFENAGYKNFLSVKCDVTSTKSIKEAAEQCREKFGMVDILVNNAGIVSGKGLLENSEEMIKKTIEVNCTSHHWTVREFLPDMMKKQAGHIVNIASMAGHTGVNKLIDYCASKHGAVGFNLSLRMELKKLNYKNINTTCICPYYINTGMFDGIKTKWPLLLNIIEENYCTQRILNGILQCEEEVYIPYLMNLILMLKGTLPNFLFDNICILFGTNEGMDEFKGRSGKQ